MQMTSAMAGNARPAAEPLLRVSGLAVRFGEIRALPAEPRTPDAAHRDPGLRVQPDATGRDLGPRLPAAVPAPDRGRVGPARAPGGRPPRLLGRPRAWLARACGRNTRHGTLVMRVTRAPGSVKLRTGGDNPRAPPGPRPAGPVEFRDRR